jgi:hypothetical protein
MPTTTASAPSNGQMTTRDAACASARDSDEDRVIDFDVWVLHTEPLGLHNCMKTILGYARTTKYYPFPVPEDIQQASWLALNAAETLIMVYPPVVVARAVAEWEEIERAPCDSSRATRDQAEQVMRVVRAAQREGQGLIFRGSHD